MLQDFTDAGPKIKISYETNSSVNNCPQKPLEVF